MKQLMVALLALCAFTFCSASCDKNETAPLQNNGTNNNDSRNHTNTNMNITIGTSHFTATLNDNETVTRFKTMLPLTINMSELNGNEKFFYFSSTLPGNGTPVGSIQSGDLMLYGNNCLVLFYEKLTTSFTYTKLGKVDNINGLKAALGTGNITVRFEL